MTRVDRPGTNPREGTNVSVLLMPVRGRVSEGVNVQTTDHDRQSILESTPTTGLLKAHRRGTSDPKKCRTDDPGFHDLFLRTKKIPDPNF